MDPQIKRYLFGKIISTSSKDPAPIIPAASDLKNWALELTHELQEGKLCMAHIEDLSYRVRVHH